MNKTITAFTIVIVLTAVFALATPFDVAVAQTTGKVIPDGEGEHKEGKSCPFKERTLHQSSEQSSQFLSLIESILFTQR